MQSSIHENLNTKQQSGLATITNSTEDSTNSDIIKKKRKRNRKKNKTNQLQKVENLISKTFQAKVEAENNKIKLEEEKFEIRNLSNMNTEKKSKNPKKTQQTKTSNSPKKNSASPTKGTSSPNNLTKNTESPTKSSNSSPVHKLGENINKPQNLNEQSTQNIIETIVSNTASTFSSVDDTISKKIERCHEDILAEREAKKIAKQLAKNKNQSEKLISNISPNSNEHPSSAIDSFEHNVEISRKGILAEREAKKLAKQLAKKGKQTNNIDSVDCAVKIAPNKEIKSLENNIKNINDNAEKKTSTKAERRAVQEAQRAAKTKTLTENQLPKIHAANTNLAGTEKKIASILKDIKIGDIKNSEKPQDVNKSLVNECKVKLFNHLDCNIKEKNLFINNSNIHPAMVRLGEQFFKRTIVGSNARCIAFLSALKSVIKDYETPPKKEFSRGLESIIKNCVDHLHNCRPLAVSISNAHKYIKLYLTQLNTDKLEIELKVEICDAIDIYIRDQIEKAALAISNYVQQKISNGDVILTFGCSSLINYILEGARARQIDFRVIVVDSRPYNEGEELLRRLVSKEIPCTYVLINAVGFIMPEVTKVLLGAHSLLANGYVMARTGTAQVALVARSFNVPVLVCCERHKFSERVQTDAIVYNELGNPHDLIISKQSKLFNWPNSNHKFSPLNINFDITPPELVTAVFTEIAILPCTSAPVILRLNTNEIGY